MKLILASARDPAAQNIVARLRELYDFEEVRDRPGVFIHEDVLLTTVDGGITQIDALPLAAEEVIIASRHASESGEPTLTVHVPGEVERRELAVASPGTIKAALKALVAARDELGLPYEVSLEATHHGPTKLEVPITFVEVGSSQKQWSDMRAAEAAARAIMAAATSPAGGRRAIGFGGPHYAPRHTEVILRTDVCVGHILPKYVQVSDALIEKAVKATRGGAELFVLDWKGLDGDARTKILSTAKKLGLSATKAHDLLREAKV